MRENCKNILTVVIGIIIVAFCWIRHKEPAVMTPTTEIVSGETVQPETPVEQVTTNEPAPVVQATNETEAALAKLGFSLSNSVKVSVK